MVHSVHHGSDVSGSDCLSLSAIRTIRLCLLSAIKAKTKWGGVQLNALILTTTVNLQSRLEIEFSLY